MARPFLLGHLSDPHIGADWGVGRDPVDGLAEVVAAILAARPRPDAILVTGDLAEHATEPECERARELLEPLGAPLHVLPGNHDDRRALSRSFDVPGADGEPVQYAVDLGPLRLIALDTTIPDADSGALDAEQLRWLDDELAAAPAQPTLIAMHHPPLATGIPAWDEFGLAEADRHALGAVIARHGQVRTLVAGHLHRVMTAMLAGRPVLTVPSTYVQGLLDFCSGRVELSGDPPGYALHAVVGGDVVSHIQPVG